MSTGLWHASHPLQLRTVKVVGTGNLSLAVVDTLLTLLEVVTVVTTICIDGLVVEFKDNGTDTIKEVTVMGDHQQCLVAAIEESLEPLNHLEVEMVRRFVKNQQVWFSDEYICQSHTLLLTTTELAHRLLQVTDLQLSENLFGFQHTFLVALMIETCIKDTLLRIEGWRLLKHTDSQVTTEDDLTVVVALHTRENRKQSRLSSTILCYQSHLLPFGYGETDVAEQYKRAKRLRQLLYIKIRSVLCHSLFVYGLQFISLPCLFVQCNPAPRLGLYVSQPR